MLVSVKSCCTVRVQYMYCTCTVLSVHVRLPTSVMNHSLWQCCFWFLVKVNDVDQQDQIKNIFLSSSYCRLYACSLEEV